MSLFRRRKSEKDKSFDRSDKEVVLQDQVYDLQAEMKRLNERLLAMQANIQSNGTASRRTDNSSALPPPLQTRIHSDPYRDGSSLSRHDQSPINRSFRTKKKPSKRNHVPKEIHFVADEPLQNGKHVARPELCVSNIFPCVDKQPLQLPGLVSVKQDGSGRISSIKSKGTVNRIDSGSVINTETVNDHKNERRSSTKLVGSDGSTRSNQKFYYVMRNGQKVKRIIRMVRAVPPSTTSVPHSTDPNTVITRPGNEGDSVTIQLSNSSHAKEPSTENSAIRKDSQSQVVASRANENEVTQTKAALPNGTARKNSDVRRLKNINRQSNLEVFDASNMSHPGDNSFGKLRSVSKQENKTTVTTLKSSEPIDQTLIGLRMKSTSKQVERSILHCPDTKSYIVSGETPMPKASDAVNGLNVCARSGVKLDEDDKSPESISRPPQGFLASVQAGVKLNPIRNLNQQISNPTESCPSSAARKTRAKRIQKSNSISATPNSSKGLLADIRAGVELKMSESGESKSRSSTTRYPEDRTVVSSPKRTDSSTQMTRNPTGGFLADIRAGVELKTVEKVATKTPNPTNPLLEGIKAGVKLKQVDRSLLEAPKKRETPMTLLLAKIQQRKQECLRRENSSSINAEEPEIDW